VAFEPGPAGYGHRLRPVDISDAARIFDMRTDAELGQFLNPTSGDVADQEAWIAAQHARAGDHYFAVEAVCGRWEGVIGLYDVRDTQAEWGRWILRRGSLAAPASALLLFTYAFDSVGLNQIYCRTMAQNLPVIDYHDGRPYTSRSKYIDSLGREFVQHTLAQTDWPTFRGALEPMANRVAARNARS